MKYRVIHIPTQEVFAEFVYEIHAKMFYESFKFVKTDDFLKVEELNKNGEWILKVIK